MILPQAKPLAFSVYAQQIALGEIVRRARSEKRSIDDFYFRVGITTGGCSGFSYYVKVDDVINDDDTTFLIDDLAVVVDRMSESYLTGTLVDYMDNLMEKKFTFSSPNATGSCGCGLSVDF